MRPVHRSLRSAAVLPVIGLLLVTTVNATDGLSGGVSENSPSQGDLGDTGLADSSRISALGVRHRQPLIHISGASGPRYGHTVGTDGIPRHRPKWETERCSVGHQGQYEEVTARRTTEYQYFAVRVENNCEYARMECVVRYQTLVHELSHAGSQTRLARRPWWESSQQTITLQPGEQQRTEAIGPSRRNAGYYEITCQRTGGE